MSLVKWLLVILVVALAYYLYTPLPADLDQKGLTLAIAIVSKIVTPIMTVAGPLCLGHKHLYESRRAGLNFMNKLTGSPVLNSDPELQVTNDVFSGVPVRVYRPKSATVPTSVLMHFHGGGWSLGTIDGEDRASRFYAKRANVVVVAVDYRMAPEDPFPASLEDCVTATVHVLTHGAQLGLDVNRVSVIGLSAGGNLAAAVPLRLLDQEFRSLPPLAGHLLISPCLQGIDFQLPSYVSNQNDPVLSRHEMVRFYLSYAGLDISDHTVHQAVKGQHLRKKTKADLAKYVHRDLIHQKEGEVTADSSDDGSAVNETLAFLAEPVLTNYLMAPVLAPDDVLKRLPPVFVIYARYDVLHDDAVLYLRRLRQAGANWASHVLNTGNHVATFITDSNLQLGSPAVEEAYDKVLKFIKHSNEQVKPKTKQP